MILFIKDNSISAYSSTQEGVIVQELITDTYPQLKSFGIKDECPGFMKFEGYTDKEICDKLNFYGFNAFLD